MSRGKVGYMWERDNGHRAERWVGRLWMEVGDVGECNHRNHERGGRTSGGASACAVEAWLAPMLLT